MPLSAEEKEGREKMRKRERAYLQKTGDDRNAP